MAVWFSIWRLSALFLIQWQFVAVAPPSGSTWTVFLKFSYSLMHILAPLGVLLLLNKMRKFRQTLGNVRMSYPRVICQTGQCCFNRKQNLFSTKSREPPIPENALFSFHRPSSNHWHSSSGHGNWNFLRCFWNLDKILQKLNGILEVRCPLTGSRMRQEA